jgi:O-antigen/teichoic acid export membrane protein
MPGLGLVVAQILGEGLGNPALARAVRRRDAGLFRPVRRLLVTLARRYGQLTLAYTASAGVTTACDGLQVLAVGWLYGASAAGFLSWAERFTILPARLVASAIGDVYRQSAATEYHRTGHFDGLTRKTLAAAGALAVVPYGLGIWLAPSLFEWLFGAQWRPAGEIASIIMVSGFVSFGVGSIDSAILVRGCGLFTIGRHSARLTGEAAAAFAAFTFSLPLATMLWLLVGIRVAVYLTDSAYAWHLAQGEDARRPLLRGRRAAQAARPGELYPAGTTGL